MNAYYNEIDPFACQWLQTLMDAGEIMPGRIDNRSITDVRADDLAGYERVHFFAGIAGWELALRLAGWEGPVWTGSCPCQPYSSAGKRQGDADPRNLWPDFFRLIRECRPPVVFGEQVSSAIRHGWLDGVCGDLEAEGYACGAAVLGAHSVSAPHIRQRLYWVAVAGPPHSRRNNEDGAATIRAQAADELAGCGEADWLADTECDGGRRDEQERGPEGRTADGRAGARIEDRACPCWRDGFGDNRARSRGHSHHALSSIVGGLGYAESDHEQRLSVPAMHGQGESAGGSGGVDRLAYTGCTPGRAEQQHDQGERTHSTAADGAGIGERREVDRLEHATLDGREQGRAESGGRGTARGCGVGGVGDCISTRLEGRQSEPGDDGPQRPTVERAGSAWSDFAIVHCRDGKARRVSYLATLQPLAHGLPVKRDDPRMEYLLARLGELGIDATAAKRMLKEARRNRVGCLRGAGNAIIPQVAAEFVRAFMETQARLFV